MEGIIDINKPEYFGDMVFCGENYQEIGRLSWATGKFTFTGNAEESAKIFFNYHLKPFVDNYIESKSK